MRLMVTMCKYISVLYVDINKFAIVVVHNGPLKKKKKKITCSYSQAHKDSKRFTKIHHVLSQFLCPLWSSG